MPNQWNKRDFLWLIRDPLHVVKVASVDHAGDR